MNLCGLFVDDYSKECAFCSIQNESNKPIKIIELRSFESEKFRERMADYKERYGHAVRNIAASLNKSTVGLMQEIPHLIIEPRYQQISHWDLLRNLSYRLLNDDFEFEKNFYRNKLISDLARSKQSRIIKPIAGSLAILLDGDVRGNAGDFHKIIHSRQKIA